MDTETYKVAKKILEKFCPETKKKIKDEQDRLNNSVQSPKVNPNSTPNSLVSVLIFFIDLYKTNYYICFKCFIYLK